VSSVVTIALALAAGGIVGHLWPIGVVAAEAVTISVLGAWLYRERKTISRHPADQALLDRILSLLARPAIKELREYDFSIMWPASLSYPFDVFVREFNSVEHRFRDQVLESARQQLYRRSDEFALAESYGHDVDRRGRRSSRRMRYVGITESEAEGIPERERLFHDAYRRILGPARELWAAHDSFVALAIERDYDVTALAGTGTPHPALRFLLDLDERYG
jgi:hypothetical protein